MGEFFHQVGELREQVVGIVRAGRSFRVILHAKKREIFVTHAFVGGVVQIHVGDFDVAGRKRVGIDAKAVILGSDFHLIGEQILHRMVGAVVAELQLEGFAAQSQAAELMSKADAEDGDATGELANIVDSIRDGLWVTGTIGEENPIGSKSKDIVRGGTSRNYSDFAMMIDEQAKNVLLDAVIVGDDSEFARIGTRARFTHLFCPGRSGQLDRALLPIVGFAAGDTAGEFLPRHGKKLFRFKDQLVGRRTVGGNHAAQRAHLADVANQRARVDIPDHGNLVTIQIELCCLCGTPIRRDLREFPDNERFNVRSRRFFVVEVRTHVADVGIGQAHDLPGITGVGEYFLITGEAGIENDFAAAARNSASSAAVKNASVFECKNCRSVLNFRQWSLLRNTSFFTRFGRR
jgi:hypothetical protein